MTSPQTTPSKRRPLVTRCDPLRLCDFIGYYKQELGCSHEEAAFATADIFRRLETKNPQLSASTCWAAEVLDPTARRSTWGFQTARIVRYFELQALNKSKREPFILIEDDMGAEFLASDAAVYFSPSALTRLIKEYWSWDQIPYFIHSDVSGSMQGSDTSSTGKAQLGVLEIHTVQRLTGALVAMVTAAARQDEARRVILNSKLCEKNCAGKGPYAIADSLAFIADRLGISGLPHTDTVASYLPQKRKGA